MAPGVGDEAMFMLTSVVAGGVVHPRRAQAGLSGAVLAGVWSSRPLRCVVFPTQWANLDIHPRLGDLFRCGGWRVERSLTRVQSAQLRVN